MRLLIDSHVYIWYLEGNPRLAGEARAALTDPNNDVAVSLATMWELAIKIRKGRLDANFLSSPLTDLLDEAGLRLLAIAPPHIERILSLSGPGRDPFDRLIAAQALCEGMTLVTRDPVFETFDGLRILRA